MTENELAAPPADAVTEAVRAMYTAYPYPSGPPKLRQGCDPELVRSWIETPPVHAGPLRVLDAGCGRGVGLIASAATAPDVDFLGVDLCERSLREAQREARRRGLRNVRFARVDLMTLEGLEVPAGGFDVVVSSGVLHHLSDPDRGLAALAGVLSEAGAISLMVYGRRGRADLYRLVRAIDALVPRSAPLEERLRVGRDLVREQVGGLVDREPWGDVHGLGDAEFVDRYLNVHERSFDVPELFAWIQRAGLEFLRWAEPADWSPEEILRDGATSARAGALSEQARYRLVDELVPRPSLELAVVRRGTTPRVPFRTAPDLLAPLAWSPEALLLTERRQVRAGERIESVRVRVRRREHDLRQDRAQVALLAEGCSAPFSPRALVLAAEERGLDERRTLEAIASLLDLEAFYRPHRSPS